MVFHSSSEKLYLSMFLLFAETLYALRLPFRFWTAVDLLPTQRCGRQSTILEAGAQICCRVGGELRTVHFEAPMWTSPVTLTSYHCKSSRTLTDHGLECYLRQCGSQSPDSLPECSV
jgi:hypothetical protein